MKLEGLSEATVLLLQNRERTGESRSPRGVVVATDVRLKLARFNLRRED